MILVYSATGESVKVGDKVPGHRLEKYYAIVEALPVNPGEPVLLCYNGEVRTIRVQPSVCDAEWRDEDDTPTPTKPQVVAATPPPRYQRLKYPEDVWEIAVREGRTDLTYFDWVRQCVQQEPPFA